MSVAVAQAQDPLVLALDIGSSASRARVFDAMGTPVRGMKARIAHGITTAPDGTAVLDADGILHEVEQLISLVLAGKRTGTRIAGVIMDTFASSLVGVDASLTALTPCYTYADARPAAQVSTLRAEFDEAVLQQRTGCRLSTSYLPARLRWLAETRPELAARVTRWLSLGEYIYAHLTGSFATSYSTAAWSGLLDRAAGAWDLSLVEASRARPEQFSAIRDTREPLTDVGTAVGARWPALGQAAWFPAIADGYASNVGSGATDATVIALAAATSGALRVLVDGVPAHVPPGLWCYRVDRRRSLYGGALNDVGRVLAWLGGTLKLPPEAIQNDALLAPPEGTTPVVLPFLTGERSPGWAAGARALFAEISVATTPLAIFRGAMEGVALRYALIAEHLREVAPAAERVLASGGVTELLPGWLQLAADALNRPVTRVDQQQATLRGAALIALDVLVPDVRRAPAATAETYAPFPGHAPYYTEARARQEALYNALMRRPT